jgi:hypothetical protein
VGFQVQHRPAEALGQPALHLVNIVFNPGQCVPFGYSSSLRRALISSRRWRLIE